MSVKFRLLKEYRNKNGSVVCDQPSDHCTFIGCVIEMIKHYYESKKTNVNIMTEYTIRKIQLG